MSNDTIFGIRDVTDEAEKLRDCLKTLAEYGNELNVYKQLFRLQAQKELEQQKQKQQLQQQDSKQTEQTCQEQEEETVVDVVSVEDSQ